MSENTLVDSETIATFINNVQTFIDKRTLNGALVASADVEFEVFSLFRPNECDLSRILGMLLDPHGSHRQGETFLASFVEMVARQQSSLHSQDWLNVSAWRGYEIECPTSAGRRLDVVLHFKGGLLGIENKPWAIDQNAQLSDYADHLENSSPGNWILVYLCNEEPSETSLLPEKAQQLRAEDRLVQVSFRSLSSWIEGCAEKSTSAKVSSFLNDFRRYIHREINGEIMRSQDTELAALVTEPEKLAASLAIAGAVDSMRNRWLEELRDDLENLARHHRFQIAWEMCAWASKGSYFTVSSTVSDRVRTLCFEWEPGLRNISWGLYGESITAHDDYERLNSIFPGKAKTDRSWPWWQDGSSGLQPFGLPEDWSTSAEAWTFIKNGDFAREIKSISSLAFESLRVRND